MGCSNCHQTNTLQANGPIDYAQCLKILSEQKDPISFLNVLCQNTSLLQQNNAVKEGMEAPSSKIQCVIIPVAGLCQEITIFDLCNEIFDKVLKCTFSSIYSRFGIDFFKEIYTQYELFLTTEDSISLLTFSKIFTRKLKHLYHIYKESKDAIDFYKYLVSYSELKVLNDCDNLEENYSILISYLAKAKFLEELSEEFTKAEYTLCQKFIRIEIDLVILMTRITELATNTQGGISGITEALRRVAIGPSNRYFEEDDFKDLYDAAEEVADVIEKLAHLYRERFKIFTESSEKVICSRPQPPVKSIIREIPVVAPTVII